MASCGISATTDSHTAHHLEEGSKRTAVSVTRSASKGRVGSDLLSIRPALELISKPTLRRERDLSDEAERITFFERVDAIVK